MLEIWNNENWNILSPELIKDLNETIIVTNDWNSTINSAKYWWILNERSIWLWEHNRILDKSKSELKEIISEKNKKIKELEDDIYYNYVRK